MRFYIYSYLFLYYFLYFLYFYYFIFSMNFIFLAMKTFYFSGKGEESIIKYRRDEMCCNKVYVPIIAYRIDIISYNIKKLFIIFI